MRRLWHFHPASRLFRAGPARLLVKLSLHTQTQSASQFSGPARLAEKFKDGRFIPILGRNKHTMRFRGGLADDHDWRAGSVSAVEVIIKSKNISSLDILGIQLRLHGKVKVKGNRFILQERHGNHFQVKPVAAQSFQG